MHFTTDISKHSLKRQALVRWAMQRLPYETILSPCNKGGPPKICSQPRSITTCLVPNPDTPLLCNLLVTQQKAQVNVCRPFKTLAITRHCPTAIFVVWNDHVTVYCLCATHAQKKWHLEELYNKVLWTQYLNANVKFRVKFHNFPPNFPSVNVSATFPHL